MRKTSKIILVTIIATSILLGLGYAAIQNITLNILGTAVAQISQDNFKVRFTKVSNISDAVNVSASVNNDVAASINVTGLTEKGQSVFAVFEIENQSEDLSTDLKISTTNSNTEYFLISSRLNESSLTAGEKTTVTVIVELLKTPIEGSESATIGVTLEAMPVEPGKEGTSEGTNDFAQTPEVKNEYGFYFGEGYSFYSDGRKITFVFFEEENGAIFVDEILYEVMSSGSCKYDTLAVQIDETENYVYFSEDGRKLLLDEENGMIAVIEETLSERYDAINDQINEYGFYFGKAYSTYNEDGNVGSIIFFENNVMAVYENGILIALFEDAVYSNEQITIVEDGEEKILTTFFDGRLIGHNGNIACLDIRYEKMHNEIKQEKNEYGFYYNYAYSMPLDNVLVSVIFYEDNTVAILEDGVVDEYITENVVYSNNCANVDGLNFEFSQDGRFASYIILNFSLDMIYVNNINEIKEQKNEYGFYFDVPYSSVVEEMERTIIFYEDGSCELFTNGEFTSSEAPNSLTYLFSKIKDEEDNVTMDVIHNGAMIDIIGNKFGIDVYYDLKYGVEEN